MDRGVFCVTLWLSTGVMCSVTTISAAPTLRGSKAEGLDPMDSNLGVLLTRCRN